MILSAVPVYLKVFMYVCLLCGGLFIPDIFSIKFNIICLWYIDILGVQLAVSIGCVLVAVFAWTDILLHV